MSLSWLGPYSVAEASLELYLHIHWGVFMCAHICMQMCVHMCVNRVRQGFLLQLLSSFFETGLLDWLNCEPQESHSLCLCRAGNASGHHHTWLRPPNIELLGSKYRSLSRAQITTV